MRRRVEGVRGLGFLGVVWVERFCRERGFLRGRKRRSILVGGLVRIYFRFYVKGGFRGSRVVSFWLKVRVVSCGFLELLGVIGEIFWVMGCVFLFF